MSEALRRKLTNAGRVLAMQDQGDFVAGHVTIRLEDDNSRFLMKPATIGLDEMTSENIITVDLDGQRVGGSMPRHNEVYIHSEVLRARSISTRSSHPRAARGRVLLARQGTAAGQQRGRLLLQAAADLLRNQRPDRDAERGKAVAKCLGDRNALILRNHGIVAAGRTVEEAVGRAQARARAGYS
jgi:L-fuculose-phosphate aldolase